MSSEINVKIRRTLQISLPSGQSAFLWGPRQVGKSSFLREQFPKSRYYDLLESDLYFSFLNHPERLREELLAAPPSAAEQPIILDEVQRIPELLNEVHWLMERKKYHFILCGSSARKLRKVGANMLGGRAWRFKMHPLVYPELGDNFDLLRVFQHGLFPRIYLQPSSNKNLKAYVQNYLKEEIKEESLTRNLPAFSRFLDCAGFCNGELVNYSNIASDVGVDSKTVKEYFDILCDTHLGYYLSPLPKKKVKRKDLRSTPKFFLCDVGLANYLSKSSITALVGTQAGNSFEHFLTNEVIYYRDYSEKEFELHFLSTARGQEIDLVINSGEILIEIKLTNNVRTKHLRTLRTFTKELNPTKALLVCQESHPRLVEAGAQQILVLPWREFLEQLWAGAIV